MTTARLALAWPLVVPAVLLSAVAEDRLPGLAIVVVAVLCALFGDRLALKLDRASQRVLMLVGAGVAFALYRAFGGAAIAGELHPAWVAVVLFVLTLGALRLLVEEPDGGYLGTVILATIAMVAAGETRIGSGYALTVAVFVIVSLWALRVSDGERAPLRSIPRRARIVAASIPFAGVLLVVAVAAPLQPFSKWMQRRMERMYEDRFLGGKVGFSDQMRIGKMARLLDSDEVALRIRGPSLHDRDLLRGAIFDHYDHGNWSLTHLAPVVAAQVLKGRAKGDDVFDVRRGSADSDRIFLPLEMNAVMTPSGSVKVDGGGIARKSLQTDTIYSFRLGARDTLPVQRATPEDTALPEPSRLRLARLAADYAEGATTPEGALTRIEAHLRHDFVYSLESNHVRAYDPVLDFLFRNHVGHCEYFASSMILLARSLGIPARAVSGYRVTERNDYLGSYIVRERDAHAWVEAQLPSGEWKTYDPTPLVEGPPRVESRGTQAMELIAYAWDSAEAWLSERTPLELIGAASVGAALFVLLRRRGAKSTDAVEGDAGYRPPTEAFARLAAALASRGHVRGRGELLDDFAARVADAELGGLIARYEALRYGDAIDATLEADLDTAALRLRKR